MKQFQRILLVFIILISTSFSQNKNVALTFDDLPASMTSVGIERLTELTEKVTSTLQQNSIKATGFVNENKLYKNGEVDDRIALLEIWLNTGNDLGNHTFSHPSLNHMDIKLFEEDVIKGETVTRLLLDEKDEELKYFRYPFLRTGNTLEKKREFEKFLKDRNYTNAPVTIENSDYIFNKIYTNARTEDNTELMKETGEKYLKFTKDIIEYFENVCDQLFGRQIKQVLLFHANEINADYLDEIIDLLKNKDYKFISLKEAIEDEVYGLDDTYTGKAGPNWLFRWDYTNFGKSVNWREEPVPDDEIMRLYNSE